MTEERMILFGFRIVVLGSEIRVVGTLKGAIRDRFSLLENHPIYGT